ncbi:MAG: carboxymuconolactone decarboxylase family protein [Eubacteriaceae bacterium]|nr:carboxymuconolactone decarboxylase family protein [Eubacteriaceae bacterium]
MPYIEPPQHIPFLLRTGIKLAEHKVKKTLMPARILTWYPKAALSSAIFESLITHEEKGISKRLLKLIRLQVSLLVTCPFCVDMNISEYQNDQITEEEIRALQGKLSIEEVETFSVEEKTALKYAFELTDTPVVLKSETIIGMKKIFDEKQFVIIASTIAQVNYWSRMIKGFGIEPVGCSNECSIDGLVENKLGK